MKGDFTRFTFKPEKHYTSVLMQQGRVQLDADWNEQANIHAYFNQSIAQDMIGNSGVAKTSGGFEIQIIDNSTDLLITPGHIYVDGILCELEGNLFDVTERVNIQSNQKQIELKSIYIDNRILEKGEWLEVELIDKNNNNQLSKKQLQIQEVDKKNQLLTFRNTENIDGDIKQLRRLTTYNNQPDYPQEIQIDSKDNSKTFVEGKNYLAYLDVWQRNISAIEDKDIREIALQGSDTATRTKTVWQVKLLELENNHISKHNLHTSTKWEALKKRNVYLNVDDTNASGGEGGWKNQLYRVEIHKGNQEQDNSAEVTFKWSRNNGAIVFPIKEIKSDYIEVSNFSRDISDSFKSEQWVEITNDVRELQGEPGTLVQLRNISQNKLFYNPATIVNDSSDSSTFPQGHNLKIRSWDSNHSNNQDAIPLKSSDRKVVLENGIQLEFEGDSFKTGDYWLIPTRAVKVNKHHIQWTFDSSDKPIPQPPEGIEHHYSALALLSYQNNQLNLVEDLRETFPSLSNCLDKTGDIMTGALEIQDNLYITGKSNQDNQYIPGKVGIGTKEPQQRLVILDKDDIKGRVAIGFNDTEQTAALAIKENVGIGYFNIPKTTALAINGKVGIGTKEPQQALVILDKDDIKGKVAIGYNKTGQKAALAIKDKVGINTILPKSDLSVLGNVAIGSTNYTEIANAPDNGLIVEGNVGIGSPNPTSAKLEVNGDVKITGDSIKNTNNFKIIDTQNQDWLNINPDAEYPGIALYNPVAISKGGLVIGELTKISDGELKVSKNTLLATTSGKVTIGNLQQVSENTLLEVAGNTIIGSSYIGDRAAPENGLLVEGKVNIGDTPKNNQPAENAQLYTQGDAYISNKLYTTDLSVTGNIELGESTQLSIAELEVSKSAFLATASGKVGIGTQQIHNNTFLGIAGNTTIGSSYINSKAAPENGLLVEGKVNIGDTPKDNQPAEDAQFYNEGDAYINGTLYTKDLSVIDNIEFVESTQLSIAELKVRKNSFLATTRNSQVSIGSQRKPNTKTLMGIAGSTTIGESYINSKAAPENGLLVEGKVSIGGTIPRNNQQAEDAQIYTEGDAYINGTLYTKDLSITDNVEFAESTQLSIAELNISKNAFLATTKNNQVSIGTQQKPNAKTLMGIAGSTTIGESYIDSKAAPENGLLVEGKVSIGGTIPRNNEARTSQLYVKGNAYINDTLLTDTIVYNQMMQRSSQQYKDNITELSIPESLQILEDLKPVKYSYITDETKRIHAGFIAEKSPEIFTSPDKTMLNSTGIIAILTNVLKEHIHTNSALNRVIANQQQEIANLRKRVNKLEEKNNKLFW
ncbi:hypothetical protein Riv7116_5198 [Rivularia sp. PCC 7116]|uniref:DUF6519 domain-containing protein n=1 Tax=Rivularia sp. PCC 7116 TaxID=373994 RepID=UPI00029EC7C7|nr:DUF6519 domain-containing protein [Rivularia sp. PCC 7116]AFY57594.1 hypothetical protein Riv7116_5198 [Rivularia sp. PCC 7116]